MSRVNVEQTLASVIKALQHFADSLDRSGILEGQIAYRDMARIIITQRLWARNEGLDDLTPRYRQVATLANKIHGLMAPYVEVMEMLRFLDADDVGVSNGEENPAADEHHETTLEENIIAVVRSRPQPMSATAIRAVVRVSTRKLSDVLSAMVATGVLNAVESKSRRRYALGV